MMKGLIVCISICIWTLSARAAETSTGIALDSKWKQQVYEFALKNVKHPAWGIAHSERNYQLTRTLAASERITLDLDVLFAAAFLHDLGGLPGFAKEGVDHAVRSVELIEPLLTQFGFPMDKFADVKEMVLGHTYYGPVPKSQPALAFRDADILDFLGIIGVARILSTTLDPEGPSSVLKPSVDTLRDFAKTMAQKCTLNASQDMAKPRQAEVTGFLNVLDTESFSAKAL